MQSVLEEPAASIFTEDKANFSPGLHSSKMFVSHYQTAMQCHNSEDHSNNELLHFFSPLLDSDET
jgi:hypothetical protein